jgi:nuclear cap-binding protein subunit 1
MDLIKNLRSKASSEDIKVSLNHFKGGLQLSEDEAEDVTSELVVQCILFVGSRSFSHFLNVLERWVKI